MAYVPLNGRLGVWGEASSISFSGTSDQQFEPPENMLIVQKNLHDSRLVPAQTAKHSKFISNVSVVKGANIGLHGPTKPPAAVRAGPKAFWYGSFLYTEINEIISLDSRGAQLRP